MFGSKWVLNELDQLKLSVSYLEVTCFKYCVLMNDDLKKFLKEVATGAFSLWSTDNVDHNICSHDGLDLLHRMGMVTSTTGATLCRRSPLKRKKILKSSEILKNRQVKIPLYISSEETGLSQMSFKVLIQLNQSSCLSKDKFLDLFWHIARFFSRPRPSWNGYMTSVSKGDYPGKASVNMLPVIDMDSTNLSCIYSTLNFIADLSKELQTTPIVTFDQPL